jgi:hypothetical protein
MISKFILQSAVMHLAELCVRLQTWGSIHICNQNLHYFMNMSLNLLLSGSYFIFSNSNFSKSYTL